MQRRDELRTVVANGKDYFYKNAASGNGRALGDGAERMLEVIGELESVDNELKGIDTLIIAGLEMEINQVDFHFTIPQHPNDAGDIIPSIETKLSNEENSDGNVLDIDDLWTIILLKEMFDVNNVEMLHREKGGE
jgi:hypothetical protein